MMSFVLTSAISLTIIKTVICIADVLLNHPNVFIDNVVLDCIVCNNGFSFQSLWKIR